MLFIFARFRSYFLLIRPWPVTAVHQFDIDNDFDIVLHDAVRFDIVSIVCLEFIFRKSIINQLYSIKRIRVFGFCRCLISFLLPPIAVSMFFLS